MSSSPKVFIETFGCAMNVRDTEHMVAELRDKKGFEQTGDPEAADLILVNTCSVREKPVAKLFSELGAFNKKKKPGAKIGVCGCTASHLGEEIIKKAPYVDFVLGARNVSKIAQVLETPKAVEIAIDYDESTYLFGDFRGETYRAYVNISIGCDKECTYCIVPHTRGEEISIPANLLVDEAKRAVDNGAKEIYLLGQNVNNYGRRFTGGGEKMTFAGLLEKISEVSGLERIRFTSPHPLHADEEFMQVFANNPKVCKHMHLPLQSGSTEILKAMKRGYSKEWFLKKAERIRELAPSATISTDVIVAFPGESDRDFEETLDVVRQVRFEQMFSFVYSPRPLTRAAEMTNTVDPDLASERLQTLQALHREQQAARMAEQVGRSTTVLFEEVREDGRLFGRSDNFYNVAVEGDPSLLGSIRNVEITATAKGALEGKLAG